MIGWRVGSVELRKRRKSVNSVGRGPLQESLMKVPRHKITISYLGKEFEVHREVDLRKYVNGKKEFEEEGNLFNAHCMCKKGNGSVIVYSGTSLKRAAVVSFKSYKVTRIEVEDSLVVDDNGLKIVRKLGPVLRDCLKKFCDSYLHRF